MTVSARTLTTLDNAEDSRRRARRAAEGMGDDPLSLKEVLHWGWHAAALYAYAALRPHREELDSWLWDYLAAGTERLDAERDARWEERQRLSLLELVDLLSAEELEVLEPGFYQGWQDRLERCRTLRRQVAGVVGWSIGSEEERGKLLLLLAAYHRLLRLPAAVELDAGAVRGEVPRLLELVERLRGAAGAAGG